MKVPAVFVSLLVGSAAFAPLPIKCDSFTKVYSEPSEEEEGGLDLDLGEMFEMFDAADKGEDFDKAVDNIKKGSD